MTSVILVIHSLELFLTSRALSSQHDVVYVIHILELFIASRALNSWLIVIQVIQHLELFITCVAFSSRPRIIHITRSPKLFIASKSSWDPESFISSTTLNCSQHLEPWAHNTELYMSSTSDSFPIGVSTDSCPLNGPWQWCHLIRV